MNVYSGELPPIQPLPPAEVEKICAGEVVERPLNVVKELVENALDAGASKISVELSDGGKELMRVSDDGHGIAYDELPLALKPHHTSKIRALDDIYALSTLGFRGEALSSIAAVSRLTLISRQASDDLGGRIEVAGGEAQPHARLSAQPGTEVEVRDLFYNVPARRKFLRSSQAETSQVVAVLSAYALAFPEVRWQLTSQGRQLLSTSGDGELLSVLGELLGRDARGQLLPIDFEFPPSAVSGYVSEPSFHRHNRQRQWYFINRRPVVSKLLYRALDDAVREFLSRGKFPVGAFFLELPSEEIDVNVHPMKREVSFAQPQAVYSLLFTAVQRALGAGGSRRQRELTRGLAAVVSPREQSPGPAAQDFAHRPAEATAATPPLSLATPPAAAVSPPAPPAGIGSEVDNVSISARLEQSTSQSAEATLAPPATELGLGLIAQIANSYLVVSTAQDLYLIDQHAAHERVLFEELYARLQASTTERPPQQQLLFPIVVQLTPAEAELASAYAEALAALGFYAEMGVGRSLVIREVPLPLAGRLSAELTHAVLAELAEQDTSSTLAEQTKQLAASLACRAAVKAGQRLPPDERYDLVLQLLSRLSSLSCPHGRPTVIRLGRAELEQLFLR